MSDSVQVSDKFPGRLARGRLPGAEYARDWLARVRERPKSQRPNYPPRVLHFLNFVSLAGGVIAAVAAVAAWSTLGRWAGLVVALGASAALADMFPVRVRYLGSVTVSTIFYSFALVVLPPATAVLVPLAAGIAYAAGALVAGSSNLRRSAFNVGQMAISIAAGALVFQFLRGHTGSLFSSPEDYVVVVITGLAYFLVNTTLVSVVSCLLHRLPLVYVWRANYQGYVVYFLGLLSAGCVLAVLWQERPLTIPMTVGLALLLHRAIGVPALLEESRMDAKTGLYNLQHFQNLVTQELSRAARFGRPVAILMGDLDLLREVNNAHGHLAGDLVIAGAVKAIKESIREHDVAARFGGEEFVIMLLETESDEAEAVAERIRQRFSEQTFRAPSGGEVFSSTISFGLSCYPTGGATAQDLIHSADMALFKAKVDGRNRVCGRREASTSDA